MKTIGRLLITVCVAVLLAVHFGNWRAIHKPLSGLDSEIFNKYVAKARITKRYGKICAIEFFDGKVEFSETEFLELSKLEALVTLYFGENQIDGDDIRFLKFFRDVKYLKLGGQEVTALKLQDLKMMPNLKEVYLRNVDLSDDEIQTLGDSLGVEFIQVN